MNQEHLNEENVWEQFACLSRVYCELIEDDSVRARDGLALIRIALLKLYSCAMQLPPVEGDFEDIPERFGHEQWDKVYRALEHRFPKDNHYWDVFNPLEQSEKDPLAKSLADDLADIWRNLSSGLVVKPSDSVLVHRGAHWHWRFTFQIHWGAHAIGALRAMHYILMQDM